MADGSKWDTQDIKYFKSVEKIQKHMRKGIWTYLCNHPEIRAIIRVIIHNAINKNPSDVIKFTSEFFNCRNTPLLIPMINEQLKRVNEQLKKGRWSDFDGSIFFSKSKESTHSLLSKASTHNNVSPMLTLALVCPKEDECDP